MNPNSEKNELFWRDFYYEEALKLYQEGDIEGAVESAKKGASYADGIYLLKCVNVDNTEMLNSISQYVKTKPLIEEITDK